MAIPVMYLDRKSFIKLQKIDCKKHKKEYFCISYVYCISIQ